MDISIGFDNFEILKIDDRDFTVEINAYLIVKWKDSRVVINKVSPSLTVEGSQKWMGMYCLIRYLTLAKKATFLVL